MIKTEFVEDAYDYTADLVAVAAGWSNRFDEQLQRLFVVTSIERRESRVEIQVGRPLEPDPGSQPVGGEASVNISKDLDSLVLLPAAVEEPGELDGGIGVPRPGVTRPAARLP